MLEDRVDARLRRQPGAFEVEGVAVAQTATVTIDPERTSAPPAKRRRVPVELRSPP
ncbi:MAG TPA: hypothetical protein VG674_18035 [Amycolatopsis sp.]|nr:hypothetical protein [Amycolatopsis sp.]